MSEQLWWVRLPTGEEFGPISTSSLQRLIEKKMVTATDEVGADPEKNYISLSKSNFYPLLNKIPEFALNEPSPEEKTEEIQKSVSKTLKTQAHEEPKAPDASKYGTARVSVIRHKADPNTLPAPSPRDIPREPSRPQPRQQDTRTRPSGNTIELKPVKSKGLNKDLLIKGALGVVVLLSVLVLLLPDEPTYSDEAIRLITPKENTRQLNDGQLDEILKKAKASFEADTFSGYLFAMNQLVTAAESVTQKSEILSLLCLTYYELWPYSHKDSEDLSAVTKLSQMTAKTDPLGPHGGTCRGIQQILNARIVEANTILDSLLAEHPDSAQLYMLKARTLEAQENYSTAGAYAQKTEQLWTAWTKPYVKEAQYMYRNGQASDAANRLREIVKNKPKHNGAKVILGIIEYKAFKHPDTAIELIKPALTAGERVEPLLVAEGAYALASSYNEKQDKKTAVDWAKKAYTIDPTLPGLKDLLLGLAGEKVFEGMSKNDREHIAIGDQYLLSSNYLSAQAHYKMAYEANDKNALAALKAGQALWKLNQGLEAIEWFKKTIQADPNKIEAYVALADVYSARFDFTAASAILQKAQRQAPKNYDVYRGFASLSFKRNDYAGAISNAKRALSLYDTDMQSTLLLARSLLGAGQARDAYTQAARAIEMEKTNPEAQSLYGEILADAQGTDAATQYLQNFNHTYPKVPEYGVSLARVLLRQERNEQALEVIQNTVSVNPQNKPALLVQGQVLAKLRRFEDALASYLAAAALDPSDGEPLFLAGHVYLDSGQPIPAISQFERVLIVSPNFPRVRLSLGKSALLLGDKERALKEIGEEKKINPGLAEPYLTAGDIQMEVKNYTKATLEYQAALKLKSQGAEVYIRLARAYRLSNQHDAALSMLRAAETRESGNAEIAKEFGAVSELKGDNMGAVKFYNRYLQILPNAPDRTAIVDRINQLGGAVE